MIVDINNLVFVEISGVNLGMTRLYGGGKVGERVVSNAPRNKQDLRIASIIWCIFDNPDPTFTLQLLSLRKS
ncbi:MAG: hypothetical protein O4753_14625 [Trichodesmium sp. St7_bin2_1]|nr:hypothetical protein [Trichodesmium sp. St7_bin2_1]